MLKITKKGYKYWLFEDSEIGLFSPSKFTINLLNNVITIVYENGLKSKNYNVIDCEIYDLGATSPFTTSSGNAFMEELENLNCPCFQKNENIYNISGGTWSELTDFDSLPDADLPLLGTEQIAIIQDGETKKLDLSTKVDKVSTAGVERAYIVNADGSQGTKATSEFKDVLEFTDLASFPVTGESGKIYVALDTNKTYRWGGSAYVQIGGGKRYQTFLFQSSSTVTLPADQKNLHQSRFTAGSSVFSTLGLTLGSGVPEPSGILDLSYLSDTGVPNITPNYISKVVNVTLSYSRNVAESGANTNVKIRLISDTKYNTDIQKICEHVITSSTLLANNEGKVTIPILTHLPLSAHSNLKWTVRSNNGVAQLFNILRLNVDIEEI